MPAGDAAPKLRSAGSGYTPPIVQDVILFNPIAGRGKAARAAAGIEQALRDLGRKPILFSTRQAGEYPELESALEGARSLIVAGGDGTIRQAAPFAMRHDTPLYQVPFGTENLFAREFGMDRRLATLVGALGNEPRTVDVGDVNGEVFLIMVSVGLDAEVIHDLMTKRSGAISHLHYLRPILKNWLGWRPGPLRIEIDGTPLPVGGPGMVVVANARQYAFRFDPAPHASMSDGLLDVVFFEARSRISFALRAARTRLRKHLGSRGVVHGTGSCVKIECDPAQRYQIDGDPALREKCEAGESSPAACLTPLHVTLRRSALRVLVP